MPRAIILNFGLSLALLSCSATVHQSEFGPPAAESRVDYGVLLMAHGGGAEWNAAVEQAARTLEDHFPVEIAFGMADASSLERAVRELESRGVRHVGVVRLFISGESWYERTQQILGTLPGAPDKADAMQHTEHSAAMAMGFWQIDTELEFHLLPEGLADAEEMDQVLITRISELSSNPAQEVAVVLAHGPGSDAENERWIAKITERTEAASSQLGLADIQVFTLREDWEDKRVEAEILIRDYITRATAAGRTALVVPFRVMGFGPYQHVLAGLEYRADETGLVPHTNVDQWIVNQSMKLQAIAQQHHLELASSRRF